MDRLGPQRELLPLYGRIFTKSEIRSWEQIIFMLNRKGPRESSSETREKHRINEQITAHEVRLIGAEGNQLGVISTREALRMAEEDGLDLVEVAAGASPPVCRILDYGKLKYREQKKAAEARKRSTTHTVKELRVRYSTDTHDLETKIRAARRFLQDGDRVRFQMRFRGREVVYKNLGEEIFKQIEEMLKDVGAVEETSPLMGQKMMVTFVPKSAAKQP